MDNDDPVLAELKKLREGPGLTIDRLKDALPVLNALDTADPREAYRQLQLLLQQLGDNQKTRALIVDFGWALEKCLGVPPSEGELQWLGQRRSSYAEIVGRNVKTVTRWSNQTLAELRALLGSERFDGHILIAAGIQKRRLLGIGVMRYERNDETRSHGQDEHYKNPAEGTSPPLLLYGFPRDWAPASISFALQFLDDDLPDKLWILVIDNVFHIGFGHERTPLEIRDDGLARFTIENPSVDQLYGAWWEC